MLCKYIFHNISSNINGLFTCTFTISCGLLLEMWQIVTCVLIINMKQKCILSAWDMFHVESYWPRVKMGIIWILYVPSYLVDLALNGKYDLPCTMNWWPLTLQYVLHTNSWVKHSKCNNKTILFWNSLWMYSVIKTNYIW